jgi:hypothetical protein
MTRGVLMYAHNNSELDYFRIACANALMVKKNLGVPVTLVTDEDTAEYGKKVLGENFVNQCFEHIILTKRNWSFDNKRTFGDTSYSAKTLQFYNCNHWEAYELSPYDETLFIDADYLIMSSALNNCWGSENEFMINHKIFTPGDAKDPYSKYIDEFGIRLYWATVIYFKKTDFSKFIFELVKHIQENYNYYRQLYSFSNSMFRNDNAFSIAIHTLNGFTDSNSNINQLPIPGLLMAWDTGDIHSVNGTNDITVYCEKDIKGTYMLARLRNQDIHIINKWALGRVADQLIELYK